MLYICMYVCGIVRMIPRYQARSPFVLKHTTSWRASEMVLGVDNAKSGICYILYVCIDCTYAL